MWAPIWALAFLALGAGLRGHLSLGLWLLVLAGLVILGLGLGLVQLRVLLLGALGLAIAQRPEPPLLPPGMDQGHLVSLAVYGASRPGARCEVLVGPDGRYRLSLPAYPCVWAKGDRIEMPGSKLVSGRRSAYIDYYVGHHGAKPGFWLELARWRQRMFVRCDAHEGASFVLASVTGMPGALRRYWRERLRRAGLGHLTAVSGLHVGSLAGALTWFALRLGGGRCPRSWARLGLDFGYLGSAVLALPLLLCFVLATGAAASACRALLCWIVIAAIMVKGLNLSRLSTLAWIAWVMLLYRPAWASSPGFYFSFVATAILLWPGPGPGSGSVSQWRTSWRLTWGLAPLSLWFFGRASMVAALANAVAIPVFALWILPIGLLAVALAAGASLLGYAHQAEQGVFELLCLAGRGGELVLALADKLGAVDLGQPWHWSVLSAWVLVLYPAGQRWIGPSPRLLLWSLVLAPYWAAGAGVRILP